jgi:hypothetical protein
MYSLFIGRLLLSQKFFLRHLFEAAPYIRRDMLTCSALVRRLAALCPDGTVPVWNTR